MLFEINFDEVNFGTLPDSLQELIDEEYIGILDSLNEGKFSIISDYFPSHLKEIYSVMSEEAFFIWLQSGKIDHKLAARHVLEKELCPEKTKEEIKSLILLNLKHMAQNYDIGWDYERQEVEQANRALVEMIVSHIKEVTEFKNFKTEFVNLDGDVGVYIRGSAFTGTPVIGIDLELIQEEDCDLEIELYKTILHELKHSEQDLKGTLNDPDSEDEAEMYAQIMVSKLGL